MTTDQHKYRDYVRILSQRFEALFLSIEAGYGFEFGTELEIVVCEALQSCLPTNYGVARGFAVDESGAKAGDDIILFEKSRFPTLAIRGQANFARKEFVPIDAIYSYLEAKHTVDLTGEGTQSLQHACRQVQDVKALCDKRPRKNPQEVRPYLTMGAGITVGLPEDFPTTLNPSHGVVLARHVRDKPGGKTLTDSREIEEIITGQTLNYIPSPDLIVLGKDVVLMPYITKNGEKCVRSPFFIPERSGYHVIRVDGTAFGIAILWLLFALDWIDLGTMPWHRIIVDALGIPP
jgi:hypothetical protein